MIKSLAQLYLDYERSEADALVNQMFDKSNPAAAAYVRFTPNELAHKSRMLASLMMKSEHEFFSARNVFTLAEQTFIDRIASMGVAGPNGLEEPTTDKGKERFARLKRDISTSVERTSRALASFRDVYEKERALEAQYKELQQARQNFRFGDVAGSVEKRFNT